MKDYNKLVSEIFEDELEGLKDARDVQTDPEIRGLFDIRMSIVERIKAKVLTGLSGVNESSEYIDGTTLLLMEPSVKKPINWSGPCEHKGGNRPCAASD